MPPVTHFTPLTPNIKGYFQGVDDAIGNISSSTHNPLTIGTANGLSLATQVLSLGLASSGVTGALSGTDWNTFNNKQPAGSYEPTFAKNTAFNKNFGTTAGTVSAGNDSRVLNGQTAFGWGNHSGLYPTYSGTGATGTWNIGISGKSGDTQQWRGYENDLNSTVHSDNPDYVLTVTGTIVGKNTSGSIKSWLGLGNNAYTSTAYLPLTGGTLTGALTGTSANFSGNITASAATLSNQVVVKSQLDAVANRLAPKIFICLLNINNTSAGISNIILNELGGGIPTIISTGTGTATLTFPSGTPLTTSKVLVYMGSYGNTEGGSFQITTNRLDLVARVGITPSAGTYIATLKIEVYN